MSASLKGRSVVVTGGSKGIGKGIARVFAGAGAKVAILARHADQAEAAAKEMGHGAFGLVGDVTSLASMEAAMKTVAGKNGGIDVICANAGIFPPARLEDMTSEQWDEVIDTNLKGTFHAIKAAIPISRNPIRDALCIIIHHRAGDRFPAGPITAPRRLASAASCAPPASKLAKYGITVNAVMPGNIITEGLAGMGEEYQKSMAASVPLKRLGSVEDIGYAALYFASKEAAYVTGQTIIVDGGQILPESLDALAQA
jgi:3-oxoacyl-[acyl-carrier protein] reductase